MASTSDCPTDRHSVRQLMRSRAAYLGRQYGHQLRLLRQKLNHVHQDDLHDLQERQLYTVMQMRVLLNTPLSQLTVNKALKLRKALLFSLEGATADARSFETKLYMDIFIITTTLLLAFSHSQCSVKSPRTLKCVIFKIIDIGHDIHDVLRLQGDLALSNLVKHEYERFRIAEDLSTSMIFFSGLITGRIDFSYQPLREDLPSVLTAPLSCKGQECAICLENIIEKEGFSVLPGCRHSFCLPCSRKLFNSTVYCPMCRCVTWFWLSNKNLRDCQRYCASLT